MAATGTAAMAEAAALRKALGNCYVMALRALRTDKGNEQWQHVKRFCEETGLKQQLLRDSLPAEITDGAEVIERAAGLPVGVRVVPSEREKGKS